jgi:hypothetical protein
MQQIIITVDENSGKYLSFFFSMKQRTSVQCSQPPEPINEELFANFLSKTARKCKPNAS